MAVQENQVQCPCLNGRHGQSCRRTYHPSHGASLNGALLTNEQFPAKWPLARPGQSSRSELARGLPIIANPCFDLQEL